MPRNSADTPDRNRNTKQNAHPSTAILWSKTSMLQIQFNPILMRASSDVDGVLPFLLSCDDVNVAVVWSLSLLTKR